MEIKHTSQPKPPITAMKNQLVKLLPLLALAIAAPAFAANNYLNHNAEPGQIAYGEMGNRHRTNHLNLTSAQQAKMAQLRATTRSQIEAVMTPEQRQKLSQLQAQRQASRASGKGMMNLTADQKARLKAIRESSQSQFKAILTPAQQAQLTQSGGWKKGGMAQLNLTPEQQTKFQQLRASARSQMAAILTPAQQQQAKARHERRQAMGNNWKSLNLTAEQRAKIQTIRQSSERELNAILTPAQQAQRKLHQGHHGNHHGMKRAV
jgi:Spy/CpxP family protein refolding chaperone